MTCDNRILLRFRWISFSPFILSARKLSSWISRCEPSNLFPSVFGSLSTRWEEYQNDDSALSQMRNRNQSLRKPDPVCFSLSLCCFFAHFGQFLKEYVRMRAITSVARQGCHFCFVLYWWKTSCICVEEKDDDDDGDDEALAAAREWSWRLFLWRFRRRKRTLHEREDRFQEAKNDRSFLDDSQCFSIHDGFQLFLFRLSSEDVPKSFLISRTMLWTMNVTQESMSSKSSMIKRSTPDDFAVQLRDFCQLFRLYASVILVVVGKAKRSFRYEGRNLRLID